MYIKPLNQCDECEKRISLQEDPLQLRTRCRACEDKYRDSINTTTTQQEETMNTQIKQANPRKSDGTSLQGYIRTPYALLVEELGLPHCDGDGYKVDAEWIVKLPSGKVATIYNYKDGHNYNGGKGLPVEEIWDWHIGGHDKSVVDELAALLDSVPHY